MTSDRTLRLKYGPRKYAAFHLLLSRWLRLFADQSKLHCYVTMGGTELRDVCSLRFIDTGLTTSVWSYEVDAQRFTLASTEVARLVALGVDVELRQTDFFLHRRSSDLPHIFFADLEGICAWSEFDTQFGEMFQDETIREGDCLIITSHLGHNPGPDKIREHFRGEFSILGVDENDLEQVRRMYRRSHPSMTLFKALCLNSIQSEVELRCFGAVKYRDDYRTPMGIYGYSVAGGATELATFVGDAGTNYFDMNGEGICKAADF